MSLLSIHIKRTISKLTLLICLLFGLDISAQVTLSADTGRPVLKPTIDGVVLKPTPDVAGGNYNLRINQAAAASPTTQALMLVPGLQVRDYGGIGGMKAISSRGLGAEHTQVSLNGMTIGGNSLAYTDFSLIPSALLATLSVDQGNIQTNNLTAQQASGGAHINLSTPVNAINELQIGLQAGSFGWFSPFAVGQYRRQIGQYLVNGYGGLQYQQAKGDYPFTYQNGNRTESGTRVNSNLWSVGLAGGLTLTPLTSDLERPTKTRLNNLGLDVYYNQSMRQLPGAVVFYNPYSEQSLAQNQLSLSSYAGFRLQPSMVLNLRVTYQSDFTHYQDPAFLNNSGGINSRYNWHSITSTSSVTYNTGSLTITPQLDQEVQQLSYGTGQVTAPQRQVWMPMLRSSYQLIKGPHDLSLAASVSRWLVTESTTESETKLMPVMGSVGLNATAIKTSCLTLVISPTTKWHNRLPTMAELYYGQSNPRQLLPEKVWMTSLTTDLSIRCHPENGNYVKLKLTGYYQRNTDKIIALPTKDLFIWSLQNIGLAAGYGFEGFAEAKFLLTKSVWTKVTGTYTVQHLRDLSNPNSANYDGQLPYLPFNTGGLRVQVGTTRYQLDWQTFISSHRYSLAQNTDANRLPAYTQHDLSATYNFNVFGRPASGYRFSSSLGVSNLFDTQYQVIQSFPIPGRQFKISLSYTI